MFWVILLALLLRLINLNQSLWLDEAFQYKAITGFSIKEMLTVYLAGDFNPPLSYLINFGFSSIFGYSEIALRLPSVIFSLLTIWLVYKFSQPKIIPALLLATSGLFLYYSQEARMYSLAAFTVTASWYFLIKKRWFWYTVFSLAAIYSHYLTIFIFPAQLFLIKKSDLKRLIFSWLGIILGFLPWLPIFFKQLAGGVQASGTNWGNVVGGLSFKTLALIPIKFLIGRIAFENNLIYSLILILPLISTAWLLFKSISKKNLLFISWLFIPLMLIIFVSFKLPVLAYFRLLFLLPAFYLLISTVKSKKILFSLVVFNLICSLVYLLNPNFHREDWRGLSQNLDQSSPVVIIPAVNAPLKYYYTGTILTTDQVPYQDFYYLPYAEPIFDSNLKFRQKIAFAGFKEVMIRHFRGNLTLIQYKK